MSFAVALPEPGQAVLVSGRLAAVETVRPYAHDGEVTHLVDVQYLDAWDFPGDDAVLWEREIDARILRLGVLRKAVFRYIKMIRNRRWRESHALIELALARLRIAESAARPPDITPPRLIPPVPAGQRMPGVITAGLRIGARCSEACEAKFALSAARRRRTRLYRCG
jgi:hypothetical protein